MGDSRQLLHNCLFFTANALARTITKMAEEEFRVTGLSPSYAFLVILVSERPGISQKAVSEILQLAPSTVTRFVDKLVQKGFVKRESEGKVTQLFPSNKAQAILPGIMKAWKRLYEGYSEVLGKERGDSLTRQIDEANIALENPGGKSV